jgi:hypothetical protein
MSGVTPTATTAELAKDVPLENKTSEAPSSSVPGTFPLTPDAQEYSVNPLPAFDGGVNPIKLAPGEKVPDPSTLTGNTTTSLIQEDPDLVAAAAEKKEAENEPRFSVAPLPAFAGGVNPIQLAPGEKVPDASTLTGNTIHSNVTEDKDLLANGGASEKAPVLPPVVTPEAERNGGILDLPPISKNLIPESSLPMGAAGLGAFDATPTIQSVGPQSTTAQLAAAVPLESTKVPEVVKESQQEAGFAPEASAVPAEVAEKSAVEKELLSEVPTVPATSEGTAGVETEKSEKTVTAGEAVAAVSAAAVAVGGAAAVLASGLASDAAAKLPESVTSKLPESVQQSINSINADSTTQTTLAKDTPEVVKESITEAGQTPEAAANETAVLEKKAVEKELLAEIKPETATGEPAPKIAETPADVETPAPETAKVEEAPKATEPTSTLNAPAFAVADKPAESREVSPGTIPGSHSVTQPTVTAGIAEATTDKKSTPAATTAGPSTPSKGADTAAASSDKADKKKKRTSFFGKLKAKLQHKD